MQFSPSSDFAMVLASQPSLNLNVGELTQWALLEQDGAKISQKSDHLIIRTPDRPNYYMGNYIHILRASVNDIETWLDIFHATFPEAEHITFQIPYRPQYDFYTTHDLELVTNIVLSTQQLPTKIALAPGYTVHALETEEDWEQYYQQAMADNTADESYDSDSYSSYMHATIANHRQKVATGTAKFFGVFLADGTCVSSLGIIVLGDLARYNSIGTAKEHRRKGLAGHLIYIAAQWAQTQGATTWVIITEETNTAVFLYRKVGFHEIAQIFELCKTPAYQPLTG